MNKSTKNPREFSIENYLCDEVKKRGGFCIKMDPNRTVGIPDRLVHLPGAIFYVETKRPKNSTIRPTQHAMIKRLRAMRITVYVCATKSEIDSVLEHYSVRNAHSETR